MVLYFGWQAAPAELSVFTDSDWAGCVTSRKSTSGGVVMRGSHLLKHWSSTQATVALSSAEAELIALVRGASEGLGVRSLAVDFGIFPGVSLATDATAAVGICKRTGVGRIRHLDTRLLWIQDKVRTGELRLYKVLGLENPADLFTKFLSSETAAGHAARIRFWPVQGRAEVTPDLSALTRSRPRGHQAEGPRSVDLMCGF